jgi:mono/diheme cytochrome c family protein
MKFLKILGWVLVVAVAAAGGAVGWFLVRFPEERPASTEKVEATPARLARGRYLLDHVTDCLVCHSDAYADRFAIPVKAGTEGQGGFPFGPKLGVPGVVQAQNITSDPEFGIGAWTDGEVMRAIREGVNRRGGALFPMMPYLGYREMSDEDVRSVVVYLRTLPPIHHAVAPRKLDFPVNLMIRLAPRPLKGPVTAPDPKNALAYGKYLVDIAGCRECHSPHDEKGRLVPGADFSGGWLLAGPWGRVVSANITPDPHNYMGQASREEFIGRFQSLLSLGGENAPVAPPGKNTVMAWTRYAGMTREDLGAIYDYLKTIRPVYKIVNRFPDAKD